MRRKRKTKTEYVDFSFRENEFVTPEMELSILRELERDGWTVVSRPDGTLRAQREVEAG